jgi:hypothetical protein
LRLTDFWEGGTSCLSTERKPQHRILWIGLDRTRRAKAHPLARQRPERSAAEPICPTDCRRNTAYGRTDPGGTVVSDRQLRYAVGIRWRFWRVAEANRGGIDDGFGATVGLCRPPASASPTKSTRVEPKSKRTTSAFSFGLECASPSCPVESWSYVPGVRRPVPLGAPVCVRRALGCALGYEIP